jgi:hypothetical protein
MEVFVQKNRWLSVVSMLAMTACASGGLEGAEGENALALVGAAPGKPVILYTDLATAPRGAFVTLYGRRFGAVRGAGTVTLNNQPVASYVRWTDGMIEVTLPANAVTGHLRVRTAAGADSPLMPLAIHTGNIYYLAANGNDSNAGTTTATPWRSFRKANDTLRPGDVLYVRGGSYTRIMDFDAIWSFYDVRDGAAGRPISFVAYPGETAVIGNNQNERCFNFYRGDGESGPDYIVIAKFVLRPGCLGVPVINMDHGRVVGNEVYGSARECHDGVIGLAGASDYKVLGNHVHDNGNMKQDHGIYLQGFGTNSNIEVAWNVIENQTGGRGIQLYGHEDGDVISNIDIHDNEISDIDRDGILLGFTDADSLELQGIRLYNNVIHRAGRCEGWAIRVTNPDATNVNIFHNTMVDNGRGDVSCDESDGVLQGQIGIEEGSDFVIQNNIFYSVARESMVVNDGGAVLSGSRNLWFGRSAPRFDTRPVLGDPRFVNAAGDFRLGAGSPAINAGLNLVGPQPDHLGIIRPQGPAADIGAYESTP